MNPINSLAFDLHSVKLADANSDTTALSNSNTPTMNNAALLQRSSSIMDSIGVQRVPSPFVPASNVINEGGTIPINAYDAEITGSTLQIPANQVNNSAFSAASNMHVSASSPSIANEPSSTLPNVASYLYNPTGLAPNVGNQAPPPGIESQWKYIDSNSNIQGPFGTNNMSQWYQGGYFTPTLQICRLATSPEPFGVNDRFIRLGELTTLVNNYQDPFVAFDFIVIRALNAVPLVTPTASEKQTVESRNLKPAANVHSDDFTYEEILDLKFEDGSYYHETQVWVPVNGRHITKVDHIPKISTYTAPISTTPTRPDQRAPLNEGKTPSHKEATSPDKQEASSNITNEEEPIVSVPTEQDEESRGAEENQNVLDEVQPKVEEEDGKDVLSNSKELKSKDTLQMTSEEQKRFAKAELMAQKLLEEQQRQEEEKKRREEQRKLKKEKKLKQKQKKEEEKLKKKKKEEGKLEKEKQKELLNQILTGDADASSPAENTATSATTNLAPWANKQPEGTVYNQISSALEDLKKENSFKKEKKPNRTQLDREQALKLQKEILGSTQTQKAQTGSAWGIKPQQPVKIGIKEELMKDNSNINGQSKINKTNNGDVKLNSTFIEEQKKLWEQVQKKTKKFNRASSLDDFISRTPSPSSTLNSSNTINAWTTVSSKSTTNATSTTAAAVNQPKSYISPDRLRSSGGLPATTKVKVNDKSKQIGSSTSIPTLKARQVKASRIPAYPGNASVSKRQEFLKWCRSQLKLNTGVQTDNVLEMLFSLPPGSESKEIIADTIYSYSSTMDGRRFATDFIKKRSECEEKINDPLSWSEVLAMPEGSSEDWEFQVVGKKKGKRF
ncbi:Syh1p [Saccharomyces paradoxus]|uniref:Syh1p n=1 Tax=Saccharomyces paradoxus TaxID=27291 RepID=A0A8B8V0X9_SACPA|nr:Syh1 [Saccharomyces paradoxus]QHS76630.1 Syh1 [Saccharomyces paradoxus]